MNFKPDVDIKQPKQITYFREKERVVDVGLTKTFYIVLQDQNFINIISFNPDKYKKPLARKEIFTT